MNPPNGRVEVNPPNGHVENNPRPGRVAEMENGRDSADSGCLEGLQSDVSSPHSSPGSPFSESRQHPGSPTSAPISISSSVPSPVVPSPQLFPRLFPAAQARMDTFMLSQAVAYHSMMMHHNQVSSPLPLHGDMSGMSGLLSGPIRREQQKRRSKPKDKGEAYLCGVCGDKALGYNFDAITCESCKAFFRRNAVKKKELACSFDNACTIDAHSRKFCPACRLKKCADIGMKREWILSDDQLHKRRIKAQVRRITMTVPQQIAGGMAPYGAGGGVAVSSAGAMAAGLGIPGAFGGPFSQTLPSTAAGHPQIGLQFPGLVSQASSMSTPTSPADFMSQQQGRPDHASLSPTSPPVHNDRVPAPGTDGAASFMSAHYSQHFMPSAAAMAAAAASSSPQPSGSGVPSSVYTPPDTPAMQPQPLAYHHLARLGQLPPDEDRESSTYRQLDTEEIHFLDSISKSYKMVFESPIPEQFSERFSSVKGLSDIWNLTDVFIRRLIRFAKNFDEFKTLRQEDQIALLKGGIIELLSIRSVFNFNPMQGDFKLDAEAPGDNKISVDIRKAQMPEQIFNQMSEHFSFVEQARSSTHGDRVTLILVMIIELFSPDRSNLTDKEPVSKAQERYSCLLRRYLESKFGYNEAQKMFPNLLLLLVKVRERGQVGSQILENLDIGSLKPLVMEMIGSVGSPPLVVPPASHRPPSSSPSSSS